jgi:hypothetical protein
MTRFLGVLMLQTRFARPLGDIGHPGSFGMPVRHRVVPGATAARVVRERARDLLPAFVAAGRALVDEGAAALTTSCGFMAVMQRELQAALPVPVWTSSLLLLPQLAHRKPGVITIDAPALGAGHFIGVGADPLTPVEGITPGSALQRCLLGDEATLDAADARAEVVAAGQRLLARHPQLDTLVLECTNLPPYAPALRAATGLAVHDVLTMLHERWAALETGN